MSDCVTGITAASWLYAGMAIGFVLGLITISLSQINRPQKTVSIEHISAELDRRKKILTEFSSIEELEEWLRDHPVQEVQR